MTKLTWGYADITEGQEEYNTKEEALRRAYELTECEGVQYSFNVVQALKSCGAFGLDGEWMRLC